MMWSDWGWSLGESAILAEGLKIEFSWYYQVEKAVWCQLFVLVDT